MQGFLTDGEAIDESSAMSAAWLDYQKIVVVLKDAETGLDKTTLKSIPAGKALVTNKRLIGPADVPGAWGFLFSILRIPICLQARVPYILGMYGYSTPKSPHCQHYFFSGSYPGIRGPGQCFGRFGFLSRF